MEITLDTILIIIILVLVFVIFVLTLKRRNNSSLISYFDSMSKMLTQNQTSSLEQINKTLINNAYLEEQKLNNIRETVDKNLSSIRQDNNNKLEEMRKTVDEKLQETLNTRLTQSFQTVSEQLQKVHEGLGEMQALASGVGDLKKVLSNVKNRGVLGEIQLSKILQDILTESQYDTNVVTIPGKSERVEFAVKLPGGDNGYVYLPIDSKFPGDTYIALQQANESADKILIEETKKQLIIRLKSEAKDIHEKYIQVPYTTEFGIMFLPTEGLYSTACDLGMLEVLQRDYHVTIAGPSTMAAMLNSLQMGFKTLAIQQRSNEVWNLLGSVKNEFEKFGSTLEKAQQRIQQTSQELDSLVGARTKAINKQLNSVQTNYLPIESYDKGDND